MKIREFTEKLLLYQKLNAVADMSYIGEEESLYNGDLSVEKNTISTIIKNPNLSSLMFYIQNKRNNRDGINLLMLILGIKPGLIFDEGIKPKLALIIEELNEAGLLAIKKANGIIYLTNEKPLEAFNPRNYLESLPHEIPLIEALNENFNLENQDDNKHQRLSYLLGYGPSWEAFENRVGWHSAQEMSCFSDSHYQQLGEVLIANHVVEDSSDALSAGVTYHRNFRRLLNQTMVLDLVLNRCAFLTFLHKTGSTFVVDGIAIRTTYFKKSYTLKKWVLETYLN